jgi:predicted DNA-binding transcriptional regulator AlpA
MTPTPTPEDPRQTMSITAIAQLVGLTRQRIHSLATSDPNFPRPQIKPGSTRVEYDRAEVEEWWANREVRQGRRTDLEKQQASPPDEASDGHASSQSPG